MKTSGYLTLESQTDGIVTIVGTSSITFTDLLAYAPSGKCYLSGSLVNMTPQTFRLKIMTEGFEDIVYEIPGFGGLQFKKHPMTSMRVAVNGTVRLKGVGFIVDFETQQDENGLLNAESIIVIPDYGRTNIYPNNDHTDISSATTTRGLNQWFFLSPHSVTNRSYSPSPSRRSLALFSLGFLTEATGLLGRLNPHSVMAVLMISERMFKSLITVVPETVFSLSSRNWAMWLELRLESLMLAMSCWHSLLIRSISLYPLLLVGVISLPYRSSSSRNVQSCSGNNSPIFMALSVFSPHILASCFDLNTFETIGNPCSLIRTLHIDRDFEIDGTL